MTATTSQAAPTEVTALPSRSKAADRHDVVAWFVGLSLAFLVAASAVSTVVPALLMVSLVFGPLAIAIVLARREDGGIRGLLRTLTIRPVLARWYLALLIPVLGSLAMVGLAVVLGAPSDHLFDELSPSALIIPLVVAVPAFAEELAWRGFALRRLLTATSPLKATLLLGIPWTAMHLALYLPGQSYADLAIWPIFAIIGSYSVLLSWVFIRTGGSVLMTGLVHALLNGTVSLSWGIDHAWEYRGVVFAVIAIGIVALGSLRRTSDHSTPTATNPNREWIG